MLLDVVKFDVGNGVHCELLLQAQIQNLLMQTFKNPTFRHKEKFVPDIFNTNE